MLKKGLILVGIVILVLAGILGFYMLKMIRQVESLSITGVDLSLLNDGVYYGEYDAGMVSAKVKVTVKEHKITGIEILKHSNGRGKAAEAIVNTIIQKQTPAVEAISGATISSKVICKAVDNSLNSK